MLAVGYAPEIEDDLAAGALRYIEKQADLGPRFLDNFRAVVGLIAAHGRVYRNVHGDYRRLHFADFPYVVYFVVYRDRVIVYLVVDATRDPALIHQLLDQRR